MVSGAKASLWDRSASIMLRAVIANDTLRALASGLADRKLYQSLIEGHPLLSPVQCQRDAYHLLRNLLRSVDHALSQDRIARAARQAILDVFVGQYVLNEDDRRAAFTEKHGFEPPGFLVISPGKRRNLTATGTRHACVARQSAQTQFLPAGVQ